jgi:hypothetical protein
MSLKILAKFLNVFTFALQQSSIVRRDGGTLTPSSTSSLLRRKPGSRADRTVWIEEQTWWS